MIYLLAHGRYVCSALLVCFKYYQQNGAQKRMEKSVLKRRLNEKSIGGVFCCLLLTNLGGADGKARLLFMS